MYFYQLIKEEFFHEDIGRYTSFGIRVIYATYGVYCELMRISDISADKERVLSLADLCTKSQLSPIHIFDVVSDSFQ